MKNLKVIMITSMLIISITGMAANFKMFKKKKKDNTSVTQTAPATGMANPASVYCEKQGGKSVTVRDRKGNEKGVCKFKNGTQIDEWDYYRQNN